MLSAMAPSNYFWTNPLAIKTFLDTEGASLRQGFQNWMKDMREGMPQIVDKSSFEVGKNLANTPGKVVFRNDLMELIQYFATTDEVHEKPILVVPPWINKYYIMDLNEKNSLIRHTVNSGYTVFLISWKNPTAEMRDLTMDDYMRLGPLAAMEVVQEITGQKEMSAVGYCIGGTMLTSTMAWLNHPKNKTPCPVSSWTLFTTLVDFEHPGELGLFIDEKAISFIEDKMKGQGYLDAKQMGTTFRLMNADGLIWHYFVNNYLYGKTPPPVDMLYWNEDSTRMPEKIHSFYLREYYLNNKLCKGEVELNGFQIDLSKIKQPVYSVAAEKDHIAPWTQVYKLHEYVSAPIRFVLSTSGHIAGVINPPLNPPKRHFWAGSPAGEKDPAVWQSKQSKTAGTWWEDWTKWLNDHCGNKIKPPQIGSRKHKILCDAPGTYVVEK
jgi:polyhydroxyalkanoate synthase